MKIPQTEMDAMVEGLEVELITIFRAMFQDIMENIDESQTVEQIIEDIDRRVS